MVNEIESYQKLFRGLKPQLVGYIQNGKMATQQNSHIQVTMKYLPEADGMTFHLNGCFYDSVPAISSRLTDWTQLPVGAKLEHSGNEKDIRIERICGPFRILNDSTFKFQLDRGVNLKEERYSFTFAVKHPGDKEYKPAVQQGEVIIPAKLKEGKVQTIMFGRIPNQRKGMKALQLHATTDAGLPVQYYVLEGPAEMKGNLLKFTPIPPKAKFL